MGLFKKSKNVKNESGDVEKIKDVNSNINADDTKIKYKFEKELILKDREIANNIFVLHSVLIKNHPEDAKIIEGMYCKTCITIGRDFSEKKFYSSMLKMTKDNFIEAFIQNKKYSIDDSIDPTNSYPNLKQRINEWSSYLSTLLNLMETSGQTCVSDYFDEYGKDDSFWDKYKKYFPERKYRTNTVLCIAKGNPLERKSRVRIDMDELKRTVHLTLEKYVEDISQSVADKVLFMQEKNLSNDLELLDYIYKNELSEEELYFTPMWEKANIQKDDTNNKANPNISVLKAGEIGEKNVDYVLSWLCNSNKNYIAVDRKSINLYTNKPCISLYNPEFRDEKQEIDHIIIGDKGIFLIETKNYGGKIVIDGHGNWTQTKNGIEKGIRNPVQQIMRHRALLKSIVGNGVSIVCIICISNDKTILEGQENCGRISHVGVVKSDLLANYISKFRSKSTLDSKKRLEYKERIESFQI